MLRRSAKKILKALGKEKDFLFWLADNKNLEYMKEMISNMKGVYPRLCPVCGYYGLFRAFGVPPRFDSLCPSCHSLERHRLFVHVDQKRNLLNGVGSILHFAPEREMEKYLRQKTSNYTSAGLYNKNVDRNEDIENISLSDECVDAVFCSHVLEHVDDAKATREVHRILKPGGLFITMVPICEGWDETYENPGIKSFEMRDLHFGQYDHVRFYGRDFIKRLEKPGLAVTVFGASPEDTVKYGFMRGEKVFVGHKPRKWSVKAGLK